MANTRIRKARLEVVGLEDRTSLSSVVGGVSISSVATYEPPPAAAVQVGTPNAIVGPNDRGSIATGSVFTYRARPMESI